MLKLIRVALTGLIVFLAAIQVIRPARTNPPTDPSRTLAANLPITPLADAALKRACRDCHSNDTTWPWYSNVAPVSWIVVDHVKSGRRHFNVADWARYDAEEQRRVLKNICKRSRDGDMPLGSYLLAHADARLTDADVQALCAWTEAALARR